MKKYITLTLTSFFFFGCSQSGISLKNNDLNNYLASDFANNVAKYFAPAQTEFTLQTKTQFEHALEKQLREKGYAISGNGIIVSETIDKISQNMFFTKYQIQQCSMSRAYGIYENTVRATSNWNIINCPNQIIDESISSDELSDDIVIDQIKKTKKTQKPKISVIKTKFKKKMYKPKIKKILKPVIQKNDDSFTIIFSKEDGNNKKEGN